MSSGLYQIDKLDDSNYDSWKVHMKSVLIHSELWGHVSQTIEKPEATAADQLAAWKLKDDKALATIVLFLKSPQLHHVKNCKVSHEAWARLEEVHFPSSPARKVTIFKQLLGLKMVQCRSISTNF